MGCSNSKPDAKDGLHSVQRQTETTTIKTTVQPQNSESVSASETRIRQQNETPVLHDSPAQSEDDDKIKGTEHMTEQNINNNDNNGNHNESESHNSGTNPGSSSTSNPAAHPGANVGECSGTTVTKVNTLGMQSSLPHSRSGAPSQSKVQPSQKDKESGESYSGLENEAAEMEAAQESFNAAIRLACLLVQPECILQHANEHVQTLVLRRALPSSLSLSTLLHKLSNLQEVILSNNQMGPQGFRAVMLAFCHNSSITSLDISNNHTDTDSAASVGKMLSANSTLVSLDVSGNHLGKDYFSRCVGPMLATNKSLKILRCEGIGSTDLCVLLEGAAQSSLTELQLSHNSLTDPNAFITTLGQWLQNTECKLKVVGLKNCGLKGDNLLDLSVAMATNTSLNKITVSANKASSVSGILEFIMAGLRHPSLISLMADDVTSEDNATWTPSQKLAEPSRLQVLSLASCGLTDSVVTSLTDAVSVGQLASLLELNLTKNTALTSKGLPTILGLTSGPDGSNLQKLSYGLNTSEEVPALLRSSTLVKLTYLNLRKAKMSPTAIGQLSLLAQKSGLETLILDGIKIAGTEALKDLLVGGSDYTLKALSLSGCSLADRDLQVVFAAIRQGLPLHMVKLSSNRITSAGVRDLVDALLSFTSHPLKLIDLHNNRVDSVGAEALGELFKSSKHTTQLHSLNVSNNAIASEGLVELVKHVGRGALITLVASDQNTRYEEEDMDEVFTQLAQTLGLSARAETGCCSLNDLPPGLLVKLIGLGGFTGDLGRLMDSAAVVTDYRLKHSQYMTFENLLDLSAAFKHQAPTPCLMSGTEWNEIIGADKDAPAWLQLANHRERALYVNHLPSSISTAKMEGILEMEADCSVEEVVLMKDIITRKNNGFAWVLFSDTQSVEKAMDFFNSGQALVFGQPFVMSRVKVEVDDAGSQQAEAAARSEMKRRAAEQAKDEAAHRRHIQESYAESQARHAYRLAHPAYADGRIW